MSYPAYRRSDPGSGRCKKTWGFNRRPVFLCSWPVTICAGTPLYEYQQYWYHINFCKVHSDSHFLLTCIRRHPCYCESGSSQIRSIINFVFWVWIHTGTGTLPISWFKKIKTLLNYYLSNSFWIRICYRIFYTDLNLHVTSLVALFCFNSN